VAPLHFTDAQFGYVNLISAAGSTLGIWAYKKWFRAVSWRPYFAVTILVSSLLSLTQLILIFGWNHPLAIPNPRNSYCSWGPINI
jgi:hypothetical protein